MWRQISARLNVLMAPCVERRYMESKKCHGLVCKSTENVDEGEVLAVVPYLACTAPIVALASPWGRQLNQALGEYALASRDVKVSYSKEGALTTAFTALAMQPGSPLEPLLRYTQLEDAPEGFLSAILGATLLAQLRQIDELNHVVLEHMQADLRKHNLHVPLSDLETAHRLCASRCVDVPGSEEVFGGPALVPVADLINHDVAAPNVTIYAESTHRLGPLLRRHSRLNLMNDLWKAYPFCVVLRATQAVPGDAEFTYQYVDPVNDPALYADKLYWASRFRFVPPEVLGNGTAAKMQSDGTAPL